MFFDTLPEDPCRPPLQFDKGILRLSGNCMPEDCDFTLGILFNEIYEYLKYNDSFTLVFRFANVGTASSKMFLDFFKKLNAIHAAEKQKKIRIYWYYPHIDEDIEELGIFYKEQSDLMARKGNYKQLYFKLKSYEYD